MRNILKRVDDAVSVVVCRIDTPLVTGLGVRRVLDAVEDCVPHRWVVAPEVALHAKHCLTLFILPRPHLLELVKVFLDTGLPPGTECSSRHFFEVVNMCLSDDVSACFDLIFGLVADIRVPLTDQLECKLVQLFEVIRRVSDFDRVVSEPFDVGKNGIDVLLLLRLRVRVVEAHDRLSPDSHGLGDLRLSEVEVHRLCVTDVEVAVGLGREASQVLSSCGLEVIVQNLLRVASIVLFLRHSFAHRLCLHICLGIGQEKCPRSISTSLLRFLLFSGCRLRLLLGLLRLH
mmetsp:Transcript_28265/g.64011  ORF Transcript_28265/g.64011 Transcript_28265/m.64011 type:complete len:288 (-) Transcript_28265:221-1084(-)